MNLNDWWPAVLATLLVFAALLLIQAFSSDGSGDSKPCVRISVVVVQQNGNAGLPQVVSQGCN